MQQAATPAPLFLLLLLLLLLLLFLFCFSAFWYSFFGASFPLAKIQYEACFCTCPIVAIHSLHFCRASFLLGQMPQRGNISLYYGTVKKSQWHSFLLLSVSPLKSFVQTTGWSNKFGRFLFLQETNHFFSRLIDLLHFTCIFSITFFTSKTKGVTYGIPI